MNMRRWRARRGQGLVEYALLIGLIAMVVLVAMMSMGDVISGMFWGPISETLRSVLGGGSSDGSSGGSTGDATGGSGGG